MASSCAFDELDGPVAGTEERVGPFEEGDDGAVLVGVYEFFGAKEALAEGDHGAIGALGPGGTEGVADPEEIIENILDGRWIERDHPGWTGEGARQPVHGAQIDGTDGTDILCEDQVRAEGSEEGLVHGVQGLAGLE